MNTKQPLSFLAGPNAARLIHEEGFHPRQVGSIAGASGGAKWLVLSQVDRVMVQELLPKLTGPVHLVGSSIGTWRFACYAQSNPLAAIDRFEEAYLEQRYSERPDAAEISAMSRQILEHVLGEGGPDEILAHPTLRTNVITVRARSLAASETRPVLAAGLLMSAAANAISRRSLGVMFVRSLFYDPRDLPPFFDMRGFPLERTELTSANLEPSIRASGSIPLVLEGVRDIEGARPGIYRDGGIIDYHLDLPTSHADRITLFPHFFDFLKPGWFDKKLKWRRHRDQHSTNMLVICPSREFVAGLPNAKVPDRTDFQNMSPPLRRKVWRSVVSACEALAEDLYETLDRGTVARAHRTALARSKSRFLSTDAGFSVTWFTRCSYPVRQNS